MTETRTATRTAIPTTDGGAPPAARRGGGGSPRRCRERRARTPGCRVFASRFPCIDNIRRGDIYVVETSEGAVIKRLTLSEVDRYVTAESINPDYAPYRIPRADIRSLWRVLCHVVYQ